MHVLALLSHSNIFFSAILRQSKNNIFKFKDHFYFHQVFRITSCYASVNNVFRFSWASKLIWVILYLD